MDKQTRYTIEHITDIFSIPEDRFDEFLVDFKSYYQMGRPMADLIQEVAKIGGIEAEVLPIRMTWIDDGKHDVTVKIGVANEAAPQSDTGEDDNEPKVGDKVTLKGFGKDLDGTEATIRSIE